MKGRLTDLSPLLLALAFVAFTDRLEAGTDVIVTPPNFAEMSYDDANQAVNDIINSVASQRIKTVGHDFIPDLVAQLRQRKLPDEKKVLVIYLLGELRPKDTDSVEVLIDNIDLKATRIDPRTDIARWGMYPAAEALVRIGVPSIGPILNCLPGEGNTLRRHLMCAVLKSVEGKDAANNQIKERLARESDPSKRTNLELSLKEMQS